MSTDLEKTVEHLHACFDKKLTDYQTYTQRCLFEIKEEYKNFVKEVELALGKIDTLLELVNAATESYNHFSEGSFEDLEVGTDLTAGSVAEWSSKYNTFLSTIAPNGWFKGDKSATVLVDDRGSTEGKKCLRYSNWHVVGKVIDVLPNRNYLIDFTSRENPNNTFGRFAVYDVTGYSGKFNFARTKGYIAPEDNSYSFNRLAIINDTTKSPNAEWTERNVSFKTPVTCSKVALVWLGECNDSSVEDKSHFIDDVKCRYLLPQPIV